MVSRRAEGKPARSNREGELGRAAQKMKKLKAKPKRFQHSRESIFTANSGGGNQTDSAESATKVTSIDHQSC